MSTVLKFIIIALVVSFVIGIVGVVSFGWTLSTSTYLASLSTIFSIIVYVLPFKQLSPILVITVASMIFRIAVRIVKTIWELIPISA